MWVIRRPGVSYVLGLLIAFAILYALGFVTHGGSAAPDTDFAVMWTGARGVVDGGDPYDPVSYAATVARYGTVANGVQVLTYPPWVAFAFVPLALLPLDVAKTVWTYGTLVLAAVAIGWLLRAFVPTLPFVHALIGFCLLASQPGVATVSSGQWSFALTAAAVVVILGLRSGRAFAGLATVVLLAKPQLFVFTGWALIQAAVARRSRGFALAATAGVLLVAVATLIVAAPALQSWIKYVALARPNDPTAPTLSALAVDLMGPRGAIVAVLVLVAALVAGARFGSAGDAWLAIWLTLSIVCATYARSYDQVIYVVPLTIAVGTVAVRSCRLAIAFATGGVALLSLGSILLYGVAAARGREDTSALVGIALLAMMIWVLWPQRDVASARTRASLDPLEADVNVVAHGL